MSHDGGIASFVHVLLIFRVPKTLYFSINNAALSLLGYRQQSLKCDAQCC